MSKLSMTPLLRFALAIDAIASALVGLPMAFAERPLAQALGLPEPLLFWAGVICFPYAALLAFLLRRETVQSVAIIAIFVGNFFWMLACLLLAFAGWLLPTTLGIVFLIAQAAFVLLFAELQWLGWRHAPVAA